MAYRSIDHARYDVLVVDVYTGVLYISDWFKNINKTTTPEDLKNHFLWLLLQRASLT